MTTVIIGLGSNIPDRLEHFKTAISYLTQHFSSIQTSSIYESEAQLRKDAPTSWNQPFLNMAIAIDTILPPKELLMILKQIEQDMGRPEDHPIWSPRKIDLDILAYGSDVIDSDILTIPHKALLERPFALWPLSDLTPKWCYPKQGPYFRKTADTLAKLFGVPYPLSPNHTPGVFQTQLTTHIL